MHSDCSELLYCARNETSRWLRIEDWNDGRVVQGTTRCVTFFNCTGRQIMSLERLQDQMSRPGGYRGRAPRPYPTFRLSSSEGTRDVSLLAVSNPPLDKCWWLCPIGPFFGVNFLTFEFLKKKKRGGGGAVFSSASSTHSRAATTVISTAAVQPMRRIIIFIICLMCLLKEVSWFGRKPIKQGAGTVLGPKKGGG